MKGTVTFETLISFEIDVEEDGIFAGAIVEMDGGEWVMRRTPQAGTTWLAQGRVRWSKVVEKALEVLEADLKKQIAATDAA